MTNASKLPTRPLHLRKLWDICLILFSLLSISIAVGGMGWILLTVIERGASVLSWDFITSPSKPYQSGPNAVQGGIANALLGTLYITLAATALTVPLAMAAGIYLAEFAKGQRIGNYLRFCANVLMGLPSIIVGLFVYILIVVPMGGVSGFAGTIALSIIMFPVIMRTTEDMLGMVPYTLRESALALGMTRMRTTLDIIARSAKNGLATGVLLSLARVAGETAPLLFTVMFADNWPEHYLSQPTANIPVLINEYTMNSPFEPMQNAGWGAALVICAIILIINIATRIIFSDKHKH